MLIAKVTDGAVVDVADYRSMFPNTSFTKGPTAQFLHENGCMKVTAFVDHDRSTQVLQPCTPYIQDDVVYTVEAVDKTAEQLAAEVAAKEAAVRKQRDRLITDTDWMALSDNTLTAEWATYRQALRDITDHVNFPHLQEADWPVKP
jgi:hypothetical protein